VSKRTKALLAIGVIAALVVGWQVAAYASHYEATLEGSNFEIDNNANLRDDTGNTLIDWANLADVDNPGNPAPAVFPEKRAKDLPTGQNDDSYAGGTKANTVCPDQTDGSIPNNKSDLLTFHAYTEPGVGGHPGFLNLAWSRVSDPSGTTLMDFELNQSKTRCPLKPNQDPADQSPNIVRTKGDILVEYSIDQGGARADINARIWDGTQWGNPIDVSDASTVCGGQPCAVGTINNTAALPANESDGLGLKAERTFGEAQLDVRFLLANSNNGCLGFGSAQLKSRSSDKITPQLKDFIKPVSIDVTNCAELKIVKTAKDASATGGTAPLNGAVFTVTGGNLPAGGTEVTTTNNGTACVSNLQPGQTYTVTEKSAPNGYKKSDATVTKTVANGATCASADASNTASFVNIPLSSIQVKFTSLAGAGKTVSSIDCAEGANALTPTPNDGTPNALDDTDETYTNLLPGTTANPKTYTCTIKVDP
jgi:Prealbumin-like fold domain